VLLGHFVLKRPELVRDLVSLIQGAEADDAIKVVVFKSADAAYFISHVDLTKIRAPVPPEVQSRAQVALERGLQTRDAEMDLARLLGDLADLK
jgi:enoyl-CoA hydratase/carnithine racemase